MLSSLEIANFKGIKTGKISDLAQVNILVGKNNSGKSTILDALLLMRCAFARIDHLGFNGIDKMIRRRVDRGPADYQELNYMLNRQEAIYIKGLFSDESDLVQEWDSLNLAVKITTHSIQRNEWTPGEYQILKESSVHNFLNLGQWNGMKLHLGNDNAVLITLTHLLDPTSLREPFLEKIWGNLFIERSDRILVDMVNEIYDLNADVLNQGNLGAYNRITVGLPKRGIAVDWLGDGLRYALNILALGVLLKGTILMVEELETHQHPGSLKKLTQTLFTLAKQQNLQLFITTHSWELMNYALEAAEQKEIGLTFHHVRLNEQGEFDSRPIPSPDAKLLADMGHDIRFQDKYIKAT